MTLHGRYYWMSSNQMQTQDLKFMGSYNELSSHESTYHTVDPPLPQIQNYDFRRAILTSE